MLTHLSNPLIVRVLVLSVRLQAELCLLLLQFVESVLSFAVLRSTLLQFYIRSGSREDRARLGSVVRVIVTEREQFVQIVGFEETSLFWILQDSIRQKLFEYLPAQKQKYTDQAL